MERTETVEEVTTDKKIAPLWRGLKVNMFLSIMMIVIATNSAITIVMLSYSANNAGFQFDTGFVKLQKLFGSVSGILLILLVIAITVAAMVAVVKNRLPESARYAIFILTIVLAVLFGATVLNGFTWSGVAYSLLAAGWIIVQVFVYLGVTKPRPARPIDNEEEVETDA